MIRPGRTLAALAWALVPSVPFSLVCARDASPATWNGERFALRLAAGETRIVTLDLLRGRYLHVAVDQENLDVKIGIRAPSGKLLATIDHLDGTERPEDLFWVAAAGGRYDLEISACDPEAAGKVELRRVAERPAGADDRLRARATAAYAGARAAEGEAKSRADRSAILARYREAAGLWRRLGEPEREAWALDRSGRLETADPALRHAGIDKLRRAAEIYQGSGRARLAAAALSKLGLIFQEDGDTAGEAHCYERAIGHLETLGDLKEVAANLNNLALARLRQGRVDESLRLHARAIETLKTTGTVVPLAKMHYNRGNLYWTLGAWHRAVEDHRQALDLLEGRDEPALKAQILAKLGDDLWEIGARGAAFERFRQSVSLWRSLESEWGLAVTLNSLGIAELESDRPEAALSAFSEAAEQMERAGSPSERAIVLTHVGRALERLGRSAIARSYYERAIALGEEGPAVSALSGAFLGIARLERLAGRLDGAERWAERAVGEIEARVEGIERPDLRAAVVADRREPYGFLVDLLAERHAREPGRGFDEEAFAVHERLEARGLLELLAAGRRSLEPSAAASLALLAGTINRMHLEQRRRPVSPGRGESSGADRSLGLLLSDYAQKAESAGSREPSGSPAPAPALARVGERLLDEETLLLEFHLGERRSFLWAVTRSARRLVELPAKAVIERAAEAAFEGLVRSKFEVEQASAGRAAARLSDLLLSPVADLLAARRLVFVASGKLSRVPFSALPEPGSLSEVPEKREPLIIRHEVVTVPSAGVLALLRARRGRPAAKQELAVIADPVLEATDPRLRASGATPKRERTRAGFQPPWRRLAFAGREAERILGLARPSRPFSALGFAANRSLIARGALADFRILHFATHGLYDDVYPEVSALALSSWDENGRPTDGLVRAYEWAGLPLRADLVVASACRTALGGDGALGQLGLTQAFFEAGARQVVVSVWDVEDQATSELMEHFYRALLIEQRTPAAALREAQLRLLKSERWRAPAFWAGFILAGDWT